MIADEAAKIAAHYDSLSDDALTMLARCPDTADLYDELVRLMVREVAA